MKGQREMTETETSRRWSDDSGQTLGFLVKIVLAVAVVGLLAVELGAPVVTKMTLDNDLQNVLLDAKAAMVGTDYNIDLAFERVAPELEENGIEVTEFKVTPSQDNPKGILHMTMVKKANSIFLTKVVKSMESYYTVEVSGETPLR